MQPNSRSVWVFSWEGETLSSYVKNVLLCDDGTGFHESNQKNKSGLTYDTKGGGTYIEAALNPFDNINEPLIYSLAPRLSKIVRKAPTVNWPLRTDELENGKSICQLILILFSKMKPK